MRQEKQARPTDTKQKTARFSTLRALLLMLCALIALGKTALAQNQVTLGPTCIDGLEVSINGGATGNPSSIGWSWGDGTSTQGFFPQTHSYASAGSYTVLVTAYYTDGSSASAPPETVTVGPGVFSQGCPFTLSATSLTFAAQIVGTTSAPQSVTLTNTSGGVLAMGSISASGNFKQTNTCGSSLATGATCTISVTFTPYTSGDFSGTVSVNAEWVQATISLTGTGVIVPTLSPSKLNFGSQQVDLPSLPKSIKFTNWGAATLSITSIKIGGADAKDFAETNTCGSSVAGGVSCEICVTFTPAATGSRSATLSITDNGGDSPQKVKLSGTGATFQAETLSVTINGLPAGTSGQVTVTGPGGYTNTLTQTTTLTNLAPGTYTVMGAIVQPSPASNTVYVPMVIGSPTVVTQNAGAAATVSYSKLVATWKAIGPSAIGGSPLPSAGKLQTFAVSNANPSLMYAAGSTQPATPYTETGVYKTTNGGSTWTQKNTGLTDPTVNALWLDQSNTNLVVAGTNSGIFRSTNGGAKWSLAGPAGLMGPTSAFLQVGGTLYAATASGVETSTANGAEAGASWSLLPNQPMPKGNSVLTLAAGGGMIYAGLNDEQVMIQYAPSQWTITCPPNPMGCPANGTVVSIAVNPNNPQNAFLVEWTGYQSPDIYETLNGGSGTGATWAPLGDLENCPLGPQVGQQAQALAFESVSGALYAGCDQYSNGNQSPLWQLPVDASTWSQVPTDGAWDIRLVDTDAEGGTGNLIIGSDQGLYFSSNGGTTWQSLNGNITSSILYGVGVEGNTIFTAAQDFGPIYSYDGGTTWNTGVGGTEGGNIVFNPVNPDYVYAFTTAGFQLSADGGQTFSYEPPLSGSEFVGGADTVAVDPDNASTIYVAAVSGIYQSTDWGVSWTLESSWPFGSSAPIPNTPLSVAVSTANSQTIFVGANNSVPCSGGNSPLCYTTDGGSTWHASNLPANCGSPVSISVNPVNTQIILVATTGTPILSCGILRSTDGGANFSASTGLSQILSSRQQGCNTSSIPSLQVDPSTSGAIAAATPAGVYLSTDFGLNWTSIRGNTVPLSVTEAIWSGGYLYESTCGEGVLRMPFAF